MKFNIIFFYLVLTNLHSVDKNNFYNNQVEEYDEDGDIPNEESICKVPLIKISDKKNKENMEIETISLLNHLYGNVNSLLEKDKKIYRYKNNKELDELSNNILKLTDNIINLNEKQKEFFHKKILNIIDDFLEKSFQIQSAITFDIKEDEIKKNIKLLSDIFKIFDQKYKETIIFFS